MRFVTGILAVVIGLTSSAFGWSGKEHIQLTRIAAMRLIADPATPPEMKQWLQTIYPQPMTMEAEKEFFFKKRVGAEPQHVTGLSLWAITPDLHAMKDPQSAKEEPFGVHEKLLHYIDLEYFVTGDAKREYKHNLSSKPKIEDIPHDMKDPRYLQAGMLPFRVEQCYQQLVKSIREKRLTDDTDDKDNAVRWAGYLAHYLEDNTQPQHGTVDYKSQTYFAARRKAPNVHAEVEYKMCDDEHNDFASLRADFWPLFEKQLDEFKDPIETNDLFQATLKVSLKSYDALPLIGLAAMKATGQQGTPEVPKGDARPFDTEMFFRFKGNYGSRPMTVMEMKAEQLAWAVKRVERVWRRAWDEASK